MGIFLSPLIFGGILTELFVRRIPNDYQYKKAYLDQHAADIQCLILGSSHAFRDVKPQCLSIRSFNAAYVSQTLDVDYKIFDAYKDKLSELEVIIIPISYFSLVSQMYEAEGAWRLKNYEIYYNIDASPNLINNFELTSLKFRTNLLRLYNYYFLKKSAITADSLGWGRFAFEKRKSKIVESGREAAERHTIKHQDLLDDNLLILSKFIDYAEDHNIQILFFTPPAHLSYTSNLSQQQLNMTLTTLRDLDEKYSNVVYANFISDESFKELDFHDADHLNELGADKLSGKLDSIINRMIRSEVITFNNPTL